MKSFIQSSLLIQIGQLSVTGEIGTPDKDQNYLIFYHGLKFLSYPCYLPSMTRGVGTLAVL